MPPIKFLHSTRMAAALFLGWLVCSAVPALAGLKIYYLRHAETGANVAKDWESAGKMDRPDYVGDADRFSPLGERQVAGIADKLKAYHFDFIAVSPLWRTRHTIMPYLAAEHRQGEIWPELAEFGQAGGGLKLVGASSLPAPAPDLLTGREVAIPEEERSAFSLIDHDVRLPKVRKNDAACSGADVTRLQELVIERIRQRFGGTNTSILLVGHSNAGRALLRVLTGNPEFLKHHLDNAALWMAEEQADGAFKVVMLNDKNPAGGE